LALFAIEHRGIGNEVLYYIVVDRFFDGNKDNNIPKWAFPLPEKIGMKEWKRLESNGQLQKFKKDFIKKYRSSEWNQAYLEKMFDETGKKMQHYQGGDLEGIIQKLDYLQDLGITAILISPIFENINGIFYGSGNTAYHGYWTKDWFRLDEHFTNPPMIDQSLEDALRGERIVKRLIESAHARGIKVLLDLSFNHTSPASQGKYLEVPAVYRDGVLVKRYCNPTKDKTCEETIDDSGFYNPTRAIKDYDDDFELQNYQMHSLIDINQRNDMAKEYLISAAKYWLTKGFDGYRIDAIKHIFPDFLLELEKELMAFKSKMTNKDLILIGEYFDGGDHNEKSIDWIESTQRYTMFDFALSTFMREFFTGTTDYDKRNTPHFAKTILENGSSVSQDYITFINNHDIPRMLTLKGANVDQYIAALKFMMVARGVPKLTYGDEIALTLKYDEIPRADMGNNLIAAGADPWCRNKMDFSWYANKSYKNYPSRSYLFHVTKKLISARKRLPLLRYGESKMLDPVKRTINQRINHDELAMVRFDKRSTKRVYYFYSRVNQSLSYKVDLPDGEYADLVDKNRVFIVEDGVINLVNMHANDAIIIELLF